MQELRTGAYLIPYTITGTTVRIAHLKFSKGFGLIGGGVEGEELIEEALRREISEEISCEDKLFKVANAVPLNGIYEFKTASPAARAATERHYFWTLKLPSEIEIASNTPQIAVVWTEINDFVNFSPHPEFIKFCKTFIVPVLTNKQS